MPRIYTRTGDLGETGLFHGPRVGKDTARVEAYGTLDELFETITWGQIGIQRKPIGLFNVNGYFDPLLEWVDLAVKEGFIRPQYRQLFIVSEDPSLLLEKLAFHEPPEGVVKLPGNGDRFG